MYCKVVFDVPLDRQFDYTVPENLQPQAVPGVRVTAPFGHMQMTGLIISVSSDSQITDSVQIKDIAEVLDEKPLFGSDLFELAQFMKKTWGGSIGQILFALVPPQTYFTAQTAGPIPPVPTLSAEQMSLAKTQAAFDKLNGYLNNGFHRVLVTGTDSRGQTQLAVQLALQSLQHYGQSLITLPDVLAAQNLTRHLQNYVDDKHILCWHSKMLLSQKKKAFSLISSGVPCVVISVRVGGLLPFKNLRFAAILHEENENYKQEENKPYFHLRDLMAFRCEQHEALLMYGSDTPSLEMLKALRQGELEEITLPDNLPSIPIQVTAKKSERSGLFSDELLQALSERMQSGKAAVLILNRRGYSNAYFCLNCGTYAKCKECGTILSREKTESGEDRLICRKCGHSESVDQTCPKCQNKIFKSRGGGTQKIVSELNQLFSSARVMRLDSDTLQHKDGQGYSVRRALDEHKADIVVGTSQALEAMQSAQVTLAAILDSDLELDSPDFRASEHFGQLLFKLKNKLAARANGQLIIQASSPDIYPFEMLHKSYESIAQEELAARESFGYPPCVQLVKVLIKAKDPVLLEAETARVMSAAASYCTEVLGPVKTSKPTDKLLKQYILFKTTEQNYAPLIATLDALKPSKKTEFRVFADPYDFY